MLKLKPKLKVSTNRALSQDPLPSQQPPRELTPSWNPSHSCHHPPSQIGPSDLPQFHRLHNRVSRLAPHHRWRSIPLLSHPHHHSPMPHSLNKASRWKEHCQLLPVGKLWACRRPLSCRLLLRGLALSLSTLIPVLIDPIVARYHPLRLLTDRGRVSTHWR